jgi:aryl-alcohol dehydrogenase-like predicted oxidoreductase
LKYVNLGNSGVLVSQFCIGGWQLPGSGRLDESRVETVDVEELRRVLRKAVDYGINFIDTANRYHGRMSPTDLDHAGGSEKMIGRVLKDFDREYFVIATKVSAQMRPWPNGEGLSRKHIMWQVSESLRRLQMEYIDLYQLHAPDPLTPKLETLKTLSNLVDRGMVRYIGESNYSAEEATELIELAEGRRLEGFVSMQELYNLLQRDVENKFPVAKKYGMAVLAYSPLAQGILSGKYLDGVAKGSRASYATDAKRFMDPEASKAVQDLDSIAKEKGMTLPQLAIAWLLKMQDRFGVSIVPVVGITRLSQLEDDVGALDIDLDPDVLQRVDEVASRVKFNPTA